MEEVQPMGDVPLITSETFDSEVRESSTPVLLDFWGPRCIPCIQLDPFVESLRNEVDGQVKVAKIIAPENRKLCAELKVAGLPTFLAFKDGNEVDRLTGNVSRDQLKELVARLTDSES
jgi:thioredoxin 1